MKHTICFIDDKIPVSQYPQYFQDTDMINESVLQFLLKSEGTQWEDKAVKHMCQTLLAKRQEWSITAFTSPSFFENYVNSNVYAPEIIIYDWDYNYAVGGDDSQINLKKILENTYALVFIFSENDNTDEIKAIIKEKDIAKYKARLGLVIKNEQRSVNALLSKIEKRYHDNFSLSFGQEIVGKSNQAINKVLADISSFSIEDFVLSIGELHDNTWVSTNQNFLDVILPRYRNQLCNYFPIKTLPISTKRSPQATNLRKIWSYRLYDNTPSTKVLRGDIIKKIRGGYYLVVSSDCHMKQFGKKNGGYLTVIPLREIRGKKSQEIAKIMDAKNIDFSSLTSSSIALTILPAVPISENRNTDFLVVPKSITSIYFPIITEEKRKPLTYEKIENYIKIASLSDPFKSPLLQFILDNITGYGCPDFPQKLKDDIKKNIK